MAASDDPFLEGNAEQKPSWLSWVVPGAVLVLCIVFAERVFGVMHVMHFCVIRSWVEQEWGDLGRLGLWACPVVIVLNCALTILCVPALPFHCAVGALFQNMYGTTKGTMIAIPTTCFGNWLGCITAFAVGRRFLRSHAQIIKKHRYLNPINQIISDEGWSLRRAFLMRLNPLTPCEVFNYAVSCTSLSFQDNAIASFGTMPIVIFEVYGGISAAAALNNAGSEGEKQGQIKKVIPMLAMASVLIVIMMYIGRSKYAQKKKEYDAKIENLIDVGEYHPPFEP